MIGRSGEERECFQVNLADKNTTRISSMTRPRCGMCAVASDGCVLVFGGYNLTNFSVLKYCDKYDPLNDR